MKLLTLVPICLLCASTEAEGPNYGEPVFVTPLIKEKRFEEALNKTRVPKEFKGNITSYSGFFTVDSAKNSSMFFWYFPAEKDNTGAPVVVYLPSSLGSSAVHSVFEDNGPFYIKPKRGMKVRQGYWSRVAHVVYFDSALGAGYSFNGDGSVDVADFDTVAKAHYKSLTQFYQLFPHLLGRSLYIAGEGYACKQVTPLAYQIYKTKGDIKLTGLIIGNGFCDPVNTIKNTNGYNLLGILDQISLQNYAKSERNTLDLIKKEKWLEAFQSYDTMIGGLETPYKTLFNNLTFYDSYDSLIRPTTISPYGPLTDFIKKDVFTRSVHVGLINFNDKTQVVQKLKAEIMKSVVQNLGELMSNYRVLFYTGTLNLEFLPRNQLTSHMQINWCGSKYYTVVQKNPWIINNQLMGSYRIVNPSSCNGSVTELILYTVGRILSFDNPKLSEEVLESYISSKFESNINNCVKEQCQ